ncbi:MAG: GDP-mannose 4,6-dehydratase [Candidatus Sungiibacteriota bacterium]|uniref:GDP-mannose 4,6-dehydratase n=1 Tax=Candidatus Sungiibacteriota bacterium TaxID=2750080 RepID=A0A7T5RJC3_9BACT|nr:MAG: GDP-mannose 4,6-dehydratase [Candidatus Sungbacteria bacterium]
MKKAKRSSKPRILLTGGSGYIGSEIRKRLGERFHFINMDIKSGRRDDVRNFKRLRRAVRSVDGVLHLAAVSRPKWGYQDPYHCLITNVVGTINVLEAVRLINPRAWIILASSREVFGNLAKFPATEKSPRNPLNAYAVSKVCGEDLQRQYAKNYGLRCLTLRFCGVYTGRRDILDRVIPHFILQALKSRPLIIEGSGRQKGDYVYIDDAVEGVRRAIHHVSSKRTGFYDHITLAAQNPITLTDLARMIIKLAGSKSSVIHAPPRSYDQQGFWGTFKKAYRLLGWRPRVSLPAGLRRSIKELRKL